MGGIMSEQAIGEKDFKFEITFDKAINRRLLLNKEVIVHCHHYNAQLQNSIETTEYTDGVKIIKDAADTVFYEEYQALLADKGGMSDEEKWNYAREIYRAHGFGLIDFGQIGSNVVYGLSSHFAEGWKVRFVLEIDETDEKVVPMTKTPFDFKIHSGDELMPNDNVNMDAITDAISQMPLYGDDQGLIPGFGIYISNVPAQFYNQISYNFEAELAKKGKDAAESARTLLAFGGEVCGIHTFHGIMNSNEWEAMIAPMIKTKPDNIFALTAITNAFGWGNWYVEDIKPGKNMTMRAYNSYESLGYREMYGKSDVPRCYMLSGVAASFMELIFSPGTLESKFGKYFSEETMCIAKGDPYCEFVIEKNV